MPDTQPTLPFLDGYRDGETFNPTRDETRLNRQMRKVYAVMADHEWHTLTDLAQGADAPEPSVSARLRDLRKAKFGSHTVDRIYLGAGLYAYRLAEKDRPL